MSGSLGDSSSDGDDLQHADLVVPDDLRARLVDAECAGTVVGYAPALDYDELGIRTVVVRVAVHERAVDTVAKELRGRNVTDVYVVTGRYNVVAIGRFAGQATLDRFLARLATDDRVRTVTATVTLDTVCEYDHLGLLEE